ncbi:LysR family transcriptional regulator [Rhodopila sp.]|uniref:LysR family transcriptional regulator n=1 Tax=Rhodopila sp. TaxID=2480087 RepID=UPI003D0F0FDA
MNDGIRTRPVAMPKARISIGTAELETFVAIAELGSFSKAAERLSLAQPSVSNRVQRLERAVKARLFERTTRAVILTQAGEKLRARVQPIIRDLHAVLDEFTNEADIRGQLVVVATTPTLAAVLLPPILKRFSKSHPSLQVEVLDQLPSKLASEISAAQLDFAVFSHQMPIEGVAFDRIAASSFMAVGPVGLAAMAGPATRVEDLAGHPFLLLDSYRLAIAGIFADMKTAFAPLRTAKNVSTLLGYVAAGLGFTVLPSLVIRLSGAASDPRYRVLPISGVGLVRDYGIGHLPGQTFSPAAKALAAAVRAELIAACAPIE